MKKKSGSSKNEPTLPEKVHSLITRKLRHQRREYDQRLNSSRLEIWQKGDEAAKAKLGSQGTRAYLEPSLKAYREVATLATHATRDWPGSVWETIRSILEKGQVVLRDGLALSTIVDEFAWAAGKRPFTLDYADAKRFKAMVLRNMRRYGSVRKDDLKSFNCQLKNAAALAECGVRNTATQAREGVSIAIDEYVMAQRQGGLTERADTGEVLEAPTAVARTSGQTIGTSANCLLNQPGKKDNWFQAIWDMTLAFFREHRRCPNQAEAWSRLCNNPPASYEITLGKHHSEPALLMSGQALGKRSFNDRWARYTNTILRNKT